MPVGLATISSWSEVMLNVQLVAVPKAIELEVAVS